MTVRLVAVAMVGSGIARAEIPRYPTEITDRPIVLLPGMTELDVAYQLRTHVYTVIDGMGNSTLRRTAFGDDRTPSLAVGHAFGGVEVDAELGKDAFAGVHVDLGLPVVFGAGASFGPRYADGSYSDIQDVSVSYKLLVAPHQFAVFAGAFVGVNERRDVFATGEQAHGVELLADARVTAEAQLTRELGIYASAAIEGPIVESSLDTPTSLGVSTQILYALYRWDFYAGGALGNVTRGHPSTFLSLGFSHRWGI